MKFIRFGVSVFLALFLSSINCTLCYLRFLLLMASLYYFYCLFLSLHSVYTLSIHFLLSVCVSFNSLATLSLAFSLTIFWPHSLSLFLYLSPYFYISCISSDGALFVLLKKNVLAEISFVQIYDLCIFCTFSVIFWEFFCSLQTSCS